MMMMMMMIYLTVSQISRIPGVAKKQTPKIICYFLSNGLEYQCEILFMWLSFLHLIAKRRYLIIFKHDEDIDI